MTEKYGWLYVPEFIKEYAVIKDISFRESFATLLDVLKQETPFIWLLNTLGYCKSDPKDWEELEGWLEIEGDKEFERFVGKKLSDFTMASIASRETVGEMLKLYERLAKEKQKKDCTEG